MKQAIQVITLIAGVVLPTSISRASTYPPITTMCVRLHDLPKGSYKETGGRSVTGGMVICHYDFSWGKLDSHNKPIPGPAGESFWAQVSYAATLAAITTANSEWAIWKDPPTIFPDAKPWNPAGLGIQRFGLFNASTNEQYLLTFRRGHFTAEIRGSGEYRQKLNRAIIAGYARLMDHHIIAYLEAHPDA